MREIEWGSDEPTSLWHNHFTHILWIWFSSHFIHSFRFVYFFLGEYYIAPKFLSIYILYSALSLSLSLACFWLPHSHFLLYSTYILLYWRWLPHKRVYLPQTTEWKKKPTLFNTNNLRAFFFSSKNFFSFFIFIVSHISVWRMKKLKWRKSRAEKRE